MRAPSLRLFFMRTLVLGVICALLGPLSVLGEERSLIHKHSFRMPWGPSNYQYWDTGGHVVMTSNVVRLTGDSPSQRGHIWNKDPVTLRNWEVEFSLIVGKDSSGLGADGMAFWLTKDRAMTGNMFGGKNPWEGLAVVFDTFDNDNQRDNPAIYALFNRGDIEYNTAADGLGGGAIGICKIDFRTKSHSAQKEGFRVRIRYEHGRLTVSTDTMAMYRQNGQDWRECLSVDLAIPYGYYMGLTAETGGLSDYHEIQFFNFYDIGGNDERPDENAQRQQQQQQQQQPQQPPQQPWQQQQQQQPPQQQEVRNEANNIPPNLPPFIAQNKAADPGTYGSADIARLDQVLASLSNKIDALDYQQKLLANTVNSRLAASPSDTVGRLDALRTLVSGVDTRVQQLVNSVAQTDNRIVETSNNIVTNIQRSGGQEEIKRELSNLRTTITQLNALVQGVQQGVIKTENMASQLRDGHEEKSQRLAQLVQESSSSWGFWTFFVVFQVLFLFVFFYWKKNQDEKNKAHFY